MFGKRLREGLIVAQKALLASGPEKIWLGLAKYDPATARALRIQRLRQLAFDLLEEEEVKEVKKWGS